jgi:outer membrane protein W
MRKFYLFTLLLSLSLFHQGFTQARKSVKRNSNGTFSVKKPGNKFLDKQFWLGFKAGTNLTQATVEQSYSIIIAPPTAIAKEKKYEKFNRFGSQAILEMTFYTKGFSFSLQPTYRRSSFEYSNGYEWIDANNANNRVVLNYNHQHTTDHAELPFILKYDIAGNKLRPYVQAGIFYAVLINANKGVEISGQDFASGSVNEFIEEPVLVGAEDLFAKNYWGVLGGAGVNYNLGNVRLTFDANYHMGLSLANSTKNRYKNDRLSGVGDSLDDIKMNNIVLSIGCLFPMRYLASGFKTLDR